MLVSVPKQALSTVSTDSIVPRSPGFRRELTRHIHTNVFFRDGWVAATYTSTDVYPTPHDAPIFARMKPCNIGGSGPWNGMWDGEVMIQTFAKTETAALASLVESLDHLQLNYDRERVREILVALACTTEATDWELRPFGVRAAKPRRKRHQFRDENGKPTYIYPETLRRHADPDCPCLHCVRDRANMKPTKPKSK
jgi:hypothetical protein